LKPHQQNHFEQGGESMVMISDRDWRAFRALREIARRRFAEQTLARCRALCRAVDPDPVGQEARLMALLAERQHEHAALFEDFRRSTASLRLHLMLHHHLLDVDELAELSLELRRTVTAEV
jgi:hypothetical protein